jgi:hypothetical protein
MKMTSDNHDIESLPKWAQTHISMLELKASVAVARKETLEKMHAVIGDKGRDWFTLTDPINGCDQDYLHLWILNTDSPFMVCSLRKGDLLFVGRKPKDVIKNE